MLRGILETSIEQFAYHNLREVSSIVRLKRKLWQASTAIICRIKSALDVFWEQIVGGTI